MFLGNEELKKGRVNSRTKFCSFGATREVCNSGMRK